MARVSAKKSVGQLMRSAVPVIESLEGRMLLSAAPSPIALPDYTRAAVDNPSPTMGYTPAQIRTAYGFDKVSIDGGSVVADGAGQTIAIIDAFSDPTLLGDVAVFDAQYGIAAPNLTIRNQTGGTILPPADGGWAGEISLDVEWSHAIAPGANIVLVETNSASDQDLTAGVLYARSLPNVSVISMSWGGSEFFQFVSPFGGSETDYDPDFTTPAGHQGITFIASAGDSGSDTQTQYPASSPNVLSVGGTTLNLDASGNYVSESSWSGTNGGYSTIEPEPNYQNAVQNSNFRSVPDVSYDADPSTGFSFYDSTPDDEGDPTGWSEVGGTSAGSPQWAALIAIANQSRASIGESTLAGPQTLSLLYGMYSAPGTTDYTDYTTDFNDVVDQSYPPPTQFGWGFGEAFTEATPGYDAITGLGTPHADAIVTALTTNDGANSSGGGGGGGGGTTTPSAPVQGSFVHLPTASTLAGSSGSVQILLFNSVVDHFTGPINITVYASTDNSAAGEDATLGTLAIRKLSLPGGATKMVKVKLSYSSSLSGNYFLVSSIAASNTDTTPTQVVSAAPVSVLPANVDLKTIFKNGDSVAVTAGKKESVFITVENIGNVTASGSITLSLYSSSDPTVDSTATLLTGGITKKINLKSGQSITVPVKFVAPAGLTPGNYFLVASIASTTSTPDSTTTNEVTAASTTA